MKFAALVASLPLNNALPKLLFTGIYSTALPDWKFAALSFSRKFSISTERTRQSAPAGIMLSMIGASCQVLFSPSLPSRHSRGSLYILSIVKSTGSLTLPRESIHIKHREIHRLIDTPAGVLLSSLKAEFSENHNTVYFICFCDALGLTQLEFSLIIHQAKYQKNTWTCYPILLTFQQLNSSYQ